MIFDKCNWLVNSYNSINFNNLPHGIIINGPRGVGKKMLAKKISEKIISNFQENLNNDHQNLFDKNNHPDFYLLDKDKYLLKDIRRQKKDSKNWDEEKGFNDVVYDLSFSKKGRKAFQKENKDVPLKKSKNNIYYLPRGKYVVKAENTETFLEVN